MISQLQVAPLKTQQSLSEQQIEHTNTTDQAPERCFGTSLNSVLNICTEQSSKELPSTTNLFNFDKVSEMLQQISHMGEELMSQIQVNNLPQYETLYRPLILSNMLKTQEACAVRPQTSTPKRNLILNWIALIHTRYGFQQETLHQATNLFNRFLSLNPIEEAEYEKLGITCLWMAAKMEERSIKTLRAWLAFGRGFNLEEIIDMEAGILTVLDFKLSLPTSLSFFHIFSTYYNMQPKTMHLCSYLLELTLLDTAYLKYKACVIGLAAIYLGFKILNIVQWNQRIIELIQVSLEDIRECAKQLCKTVQLASTNPLSSIYRKYSSRQYSQVAKIKFGRKKE